MFILKLCLRRFDRIFKQLRVALSNAWIDLQIADSKMIGSDRRLCNKHF